MQRRRQSVALEGAFHFRNGTERLMGLKSAKRTALAALLIVAIVGLLFGGKESRLLHSGRVLEASMSGHGPNPESTNKYMSGSDVWWNYCISSENLFYSVLLRTSPEKSGLKPNTIVRFWEDGKWMYIPNPKGHPLALRILRKGKDKKCP